MEAYGTPNVSAPPQRPQFTVSQKRWFLSHHLPIWRYSPTSRWWGCCREWDCCRWEVEEKLSHVQSITGMFEWAPLSFLIEQESTVMISPVGKKVMLACTLNYLYDDEGDGWRQPMPASIWSRFCALVSTEISCKIKVVWTELCFVKEGKNTHFQRYLYACRQGKLRQRTQSWEFEQDDDADSWIIVLAQGVIHLPVNRSLIDTPCINHIRQNHLKQSPNITIHHSALETLLHGLQIT